MLSPLISLNYVLLNRLRSRPTSGVAQRLGRYFSIVIGAYAKADRHVGRLLQKLRFSPISTWPRRPLKDAS